jgi:hypothetical protein
MKSRVPKTRKSRKSQKLKFQKKKKKKTWVKYLTVGSSWTEFQKCRAERELRKPIGIEMSFVLVRISYKCCGLFLKF